MSGFGACTSPHADAASRQARTARQLARFHQVRHRIGGEKGRVEGFPRLDFLFETGGGAELDRQRMSDRAFRLRPQFIHHGLHPI
jgi:hypothetical protein